MNWFTGQSKRKKALIIALIAAVIGLLGFSYSVFAEASGNGEKAVRTAKAGKTESNSSEKKDAGISKKGTNGNEEIVYVMEKPDGKEYQRIVSAGGDLHYEGYEDCILPINMDVTYKLDGKEISPDQLAGQIGHVEIDIKYTNNMNQGNVYTPFVAITGVIMDNDDFSNVTVDNGKVMDDGSRTVVMGYAMPGMNESLRVDSVDLDIPDSVHIEADTIGYEVEEIYTIVSDNLFADLSGKDTGDLDELKDKLDELANGMDDLTGGMSKMAKAANTLDQGATKLDSGADALEQGASSLADGTFALHKAVKGSLAKGVPKLVKGSKKLSKGSAALSKGISDPDSEKSLVNGAAALKKGSSQLAAGTGQLKQGVGKLSESTVQLKDGAAQVNAGIQALVTKVSEGSDTSQIDTNIQKIESATNCKSQDDFDQAMADLIAAMGQEGADVQKLSQRVAGLAEAKGQWETLQQMKATMSASQSEADQKQVQALLTGAAELEKGTAQLDSAVNTSTKEQPGLVDSVAALDQGASGLAKGASALNDGVGVISSNMKAIASGNKALYKGLKKLQGGTDKLAKSTGKLNSGANQLSDGAEQLSSGLDQLSNGTGKFASAISKASGELKDKLSDMDTDELNRVMDNFDSLKAAAERYKSFEGDGSYDSVTFIYKMDGVAEE